MAHQINFRFQTATAFIVRMGPDLYAVSDLIALDLRKGHATGVMQQIARYADKHGITLRLIAKEYGAVQQMTNQQLVKFYEKFGFHLDDPNPPYTMTRFPERTANAQASSHSLGRSRPDGVLFSVPEDGQGRPQASESSS